MGNLYDCMMDRLGLNFDSAATNQITEVHGLLV